MPFKIHHKSSQFTTIPESLNMVITIISILSKGGRKITKEKTKDEMLNKFANRHDTITVNVKARRLHAL